jgi:transposase
VDETRLGLLPVLTACWMRKGSQIRISTPGQQEWCHLFGAYNWVTDELIYTFSKYGNSEGFMVFLDHLVQAHDGQRPLVIVLDNAPIHRSKATQAAFTLLEGDLLPLFLPKYCSQLNPIERFWRYMKRSACANKLFANMDDLIASVNQVLHLQNDCLSDSRFMFLKYFQ